MNDLKLWADYAWVNMGSQRREAIKFLTDKPVTVEKLREIVNEKSNLKLSLREMSRHLTSFAEKGFAKCVNPEAPYKRLYIITKKGKKIREQFLH